MAELILTSAANVATRGAPALVRGLASAAATYAGRALDQRLFGENRRIEGPRRAEIHLNGSSEGASLPEVFGRVRLSGQVIWAARPKENARTETTRGGGKGGGPRTTATTYSYTLSFAVALCSGRATRLERAWANGEPLDLSTLAYRFHDGAEDQFPDPLIEAIEGASAAPGYRGVAYVVFEDFPLDPFGGAIPQLSFEVLRKAPRPDGERRLEDMARGVCLIPGAGEFALATTPVLRAAGYGREIAENRHAAGDKADLVVSLDQLEQDLPHCRSVMLVVGWFGTDLRAGQCEVRPGIEIATKDTRPLAWRAGGVTRAGARLVSQIEGGPAYGGTPADQSVIEAIRELKRRGFAVSLLPFLFMDVPPGNGLPDPYGGAEQAAFPWRGRIVPGADVAGDVTRFFGAAEPAHAIRSGDVVSYAGPAEWSFRRFVFHCARLADAAGGVDAFVLGSELRGLTTAKTAAGAFPAVNELKRLAADLRGMLGAGVKLTYGADWSEYFGFQPQDGSGDVYFHLDPLWADANIDAIGIDWYPPMTDWRDGTGHLDAAAAESPYDPAYLASRVAGGEQFDWFYASAADRVAQQRTPIADGAHGKPWVFRPKDIVSWWSNPHVERRGGAELAAPTAWVPQSKPIWLVELGCPAVDKGANAPNLFVAAHSAESALPPFSSGAPDDAIQRAALEAHLARAEAAGSALNPISTVYDGPMLAPERVWLWAWDARPFPAFPSRADVWSDAPAWRLGHWLNGRAGASLLKDVVRALTLDAGLPAPDAEAAPGAVAGIVYDAPTTARAALQPLMDAFGLVCVEREGVLRFSRAGALLEGAISAADLVDGAFARRREDCAVAPREARVSYVDATLDYQSGLARARRNDGAETGAIDADLALVMVAGDAEAVAERLLAEARAEARGLTLALAPTRLDLEPGDRLTLDLPGAHGVFRVARTEAGETLALSLVPDVAPRAPFAAAPPAVARPRTQAQPRAEILDLPALPGFESDERPLLAVFADPWPGAAELRIAGRTRGEARSPAIMGELLWALYPGPVGRSDDGNRVRVRLAGPAPASVTRAALLDGANLFAVRAGTAWEVLQAQSVAQVETETYELSGLLRGQFGTAPFMGAPTPVGAPIVLLDQRLTRLDLGADEWGAPLAWSLTAGAETAQGSVTLARAAARPYRPAHPRAVLQPDGSALLTWVRCGRVGALAWSVAEIPLGEEVERYVVEVWRAGGLVRTAETSAPQLLLSPADLAGGGLVSWRVAQWTPSYGLGPFAESTLWV